MEFSKRRRPSFADSFAADEEEYDDYDRSHDFDHHPDHQEMRAGGDKKKAVTSAGTVTSKAATNSTDELSLFLMDVCSPHCLKTCASCQPRWSHVPSPAAEKTLIADLENKHGIVKRISPTTKNKTVQVDVQNKHMKGILTNVFDGYPNFHASLLPKDSAWVFHEPFNMFVGRWDQLREYKLRTSSHAEKSAWVALVAAMKPVVQPTLDSIKRIKDTGLVIWKDLPLIFPPGKMIIVEEPGDVQSVVRVQEGKSTYDRMSSQSTHTLKYEYIDWDGKIRGLRTSTLTIPQYTGHKKVAVSTLNTIPLDFCPEEEELRTKLIARGRRWTSWNKVEYKQFRGKKVPISTGVSIEASGRIMIDAAAFYDNNPKNQLRRKPTLRSLAAKSDVDDMDESAQSTQVSDEQCLLASGIVCGFDLKAKDWCLFPVDGVSDITFNSLAYDNLVLPPSEKKMAWAFVESKTRLMDASDSDGSTAFDDFVVDKGKGLVMLLCGSPGVGKTYTAEAIAEMAKVPLYMMSAGELGSVSGDVEVALDTALDLCRRWRAMLLLDEADVFLGKRFSGGNESIERNELVSIFLRRLEYYQGTMFLTTNKIENIDDAFQSRIDIILPYGDLTAEARLQVWTNFINKSGGTEAFNLTKHQIQQLAQNYHLNGREIKNLVKSSLLVAGKFGGPGFDTAAANKDPAQAKVTMAVLETLAAMRIRAHKLMGKTEDNGGV